MPCPLCSSKLCDKSGIAFGSNLNLRILLKALGRAEKAADEEEGECDHGDDEARYRGAEEIPASLLQDPAFRQHDNRRHELEELLWSTRVASFLQ